MGLKAIPMQSLQLFNGLNLTFSTHLTLASQMLGLSRLLRFYFSVRIYHFRQTPELRLTYRSGARLTGGFYFD